MKMDPKERRRLQNLVNLKRNNWKNARSDTENPHDRQNLESGTIPFEPLPADANYYYVDSARRKVLSYDARLRLMMQDCEYGGGYILIVHRIPWLLWNRELN